MILYVRLDLTLSKDEATEAKMRVSSHCEQVHTHHDKRARLYEKLEEEIHKLKSSKDVAQSQVRMQLLVFLRQMWMPFQIVNVPSSDRVGLRSAV